MKAWYRRRTFLAGVALIVIVNAIALTGVAFNRSAATGGTLVLTQRELSMPYNYWRNTENSGLALRVNWRIPATLPRAGGIWYGGEAEWLDAAKIAELGIRTRSAPGDYESSFWRSVPADVLMVLELNGPAYRRALELACDKAARSAQKSDVALCESEKHESSRLFIIDAGLDRDVLRAKYPDAASYAIAHGKVQATWISDGSKKQLVGLVNDLAIDELQVPLPMRAALAADGGVLWRSPDKTAPFEATVTFGRRLEPWIVQLVPKPEKTG